MATTTAAPAEKTSLPDITISVRQVFGLDSEMPDELADLRLAALVRAILRTLANGYV